MYLRNVLVVGSRFSSFYWALPQTMCHQISWHSADFLTNAVSQTVSHQGLPSCPVQKISLGITTDAGLDHTWYRNALDSFAQAPPSLHTTALLNYTSYFTSCEGSTGPHHIQCWFSAGMHRLSLMWVPGWTLFFFCSEKSWGLESWGLEHRAVLDKVTQ